MENIDKFLSSLQGKLVETISAPVNKDARNDEDYTYIVTPSPNIIEWATRYEYINLPSLFQHTRQYQIIRDFFQLRCPLPCCNDQSPEAQDCWGKGKEFLQSENLLVWNKSAGEDACPKCNTTRSELVKDGLLKLYNQMHVVAGMRCLSLNALISTNIGIVELGSLLPRDPVPDTFYPLDNVHVVGENGPEQASHVYYAGMLPSVKVRLRNGIEHIGSPVHPVYGYSGGKWGFIKLGDIKPGDYIEIRTPHAFDMQSYVFSDRIARRIRNFPFKVQQWSDDLASILGYITAAARYNVNYGLKVVHKYNYVAKDHLAAAFKRVFKYSLRSDLNDAFIVDPPKIFCEFLKAFDVDFEKSPYRKFPRSVLSAPKSCIIAFLRAFYELAGMVVIDDVRSGVDVMITSREFAEDLQQMLFSVGIDSYIKPKKVLQPNGDRRRAYFVCVHRAAAVSFSEIVGFMSVKKRARLRIALTKIGTVRDTIIPGVRQKIDELGKTTLLPYSLAVSADKHKLIRSKGVKTALRRMEDTLPSEEYDLFFRLVNPKSRYIKVKTIENGPMMEMGDLHVPGTHTFVANSVMNHNSGKSSVAAVIGTYVEHRVLAMGHNAIGGLSGYFNQVPGQQFDIAFTASTDVQSQDTIWAKFTGLRNNSPWMTKYKKWIKKKEAEQVTYDGNKSWQYDEQNKVIINGSLNLKINSMNSNSSGMAGRTRLAAFIDEIARFDGTDSSRSADEAYRVLENSLITIRPLSAKDKSIPWLGTMVSISSPISEGDKSMRLLKQAPSIRRMYYGHYATWEFNPYQPRENFDDDFEKDPIGAMRDFGARPPTTATPLIEDPTRFREMSIDKALLPTAEFAKTYHTDRTGIEYVSIRLSSSKLERNNERYLSFDAGETFDQFAGACAHGEWVHTAEGKQLITVYDWVFRILPENKPKRDVWFDSVTQIVESLSKYYFIGKVEFDRWQSSYLIQRIRDMGIMAETKGSTAETFSKFINDVKFSRVKMLAPASDDYVRNPTEMTAAGLAFYELEHLERTPDLRKVYNPKKGKRRGWDSDDVATVVVHVNDMVQAAVADTGTGNSIKQRKHRETVGGGQWVDRGALFMPRNKGSPGSRGW